MQSNLCCITSFQDKVFLELQQIGVAADQIELTVKAAFFIIKGLLTYQLLDTEKVSLRSNSWQFFSSIRWYKLHRPNY